MSFVLLLNIFVGIIFLLYITLRRRFQYWKNRNVPYIEPELYYGNARGIGKDYHFGDFLKKMYFKLKPFGPIGGIYINYRLSAIVTDLELIKSILIKDFNIFQNRGVYFNEKDDPISANLVAVEDDTWKNLRQKITFAFTSAKMKTMFFTIADVTDRLIQTIESENEKIGPIEVKDLFARFALDVIGSAAFGIECNSLADKSNKFYEMSVKHFQSFRFLKRIFTQTFRDLARRLHIISTDKEVSQFYLDVVRKSIEHRKMNPQIQRNDFMNILIKMLDSTGVDSLTFHEVAAQAFVFLTAGYETTAITLTYCLYELSQNEDVQRKARESVVEALTKYENNFTYDSINEMHYLEQCINEGLRKHPPVITHQRVAKVNYPIPNTKISIEKGMTIIIPIKGIHHDPNIYAEPHKYDPDRFAPDEIAKRLPFSFLPFGGGPRGCIAIRFAMLEIKIALAKILLNYELQLDRTKTSVPIEICPGKLISTPANGVFVAFKKLEHCPIVK